MENVIVITDIGIQLILKERVLLLLAIITNITIYKEILVNRNLVILLELLFLLAPSNRS